MQEPLSLRQRLWRNTRSRVIAGILFVVPVGVTFWILELLFKFVGGVLHINDLAENLIKRDSQWVPWVALAIGFIATLILIYLIGIVATNVVGRRLLQFGESLILRLPIVKSIYGSAKQVVQTVSVPEGSQFKSVVLIEFPSPGMWSLGFNTGTMQDKHGKKFVKVYVPTTPNPTSGFLELLAEEDVKKTDITVEDALKMIISGGILSPEKFEIWP
ncbi:DUF502 domain-containing protein [Candidatus Acetothermia bacterium]|nr:DUF502 domain-containing protein [Candidatus Acetothermia bacterium]MBI3659024.1 DUF502 domain-containing protein [Candidatus Acetothermia bacterium]